MLPLARSRACGRSLWSLSRGGGGGGGRGGGSSARRTAGSSSGTPPRAAPAAAHSAAPGEGRYAGADPSQPPRFYAPELPPAPGRSVQLGAEEARHAARALRLRPGDALELCDGRGGVVLCELVASEKGSATVCALEPPRALSWRGPRFVLAAGCLGLPGGRADWLVEKATELGAASLVPLITDRSQSGSARSKFRTRGKGPADAAAAEAEAAAADFRPAGRLERLAAAAMKQAQRAHALELRAPAALRELLPAVAAAPVALVAAGGAPPVLRQLEAAAARGGGGVEAWDGRECWLFIGPEGDFTPDEMGALVEAGARPVGLGPHRLRTETAAMAALAAAVAFADGAGGGGDGGGGV
ncbi:ribosomal RNA small subunit methyltransferase E [Raphidocelis subcapitata]|uniref:16S rRNA (uracil(1498)-N(3))-methyltransferase n=1 Tax=Raphidocelis subcapitata TaxID=307507 RepID=A0A2V0NTG5_9CHLO|nr:ribosomal RNA small subunit methyltransferase E [Raphidocelis subcapitata]|eukprot:GBF90968.1 ribosomal RNA small subunit methyltransferase E [Raphidocelis subcapitata]